MTQQQRFVVVVELTFGNGTRIVAVEAVDRDDAVDQAYRQLFGASYTAASSYGRGHHREAKKTTVIRGSLPDGRAQSERGFPTESTATRVKRPEVARWLPAPARSSA